MRSWHEANTCPASMISRTIAAPSATDRAKRSTRITTMPSDVAVPQALQRRLETGPLDVAARVVLVVVPRDDLAAQLAARSFSIASRWTSGEM